MAKSKARINYVPSSVQPTKWLLSRQNRRLSEKEQKETETSRGVFKCRGDKGGFVH